MKFTTEEAMRVVDQANGCDEHPCNVPFEANDVDRVFYVESGCSCGSSLKGGECNTYCDTWSEAILRLKDGRYVRARESADTSGHG